MSVTFKYSLNPVALQSFDQEKALFETELIHLSCSLEEKCVTLCNFCIPSHLIHTIIYPILLYGADSLITTLSSILTAPG